MSTDGRIDDLIEAGWWVLESDFDPVAFQQWRRRAFDCLTAMVGSDHAYTRNFERFVRQEGKADLLIASGILSAAKEEMAGNRLEPSEVHGSEVGLSPFTEKTRSAVRR